MTQNDRGAHLAQFNMFSDGPPTPPAKSSLKMPAGRTADVALSGQEMVDHLAATGRYRILRKLESRPVVGSLRPEFPHKGIILDTETTGLNHRKEEIIEIGLITFTFDDHGSIGDVIGIYGGLQQPSRPIPREITKLTGITDHMVAGQKIDMEAVETHVAPKDLIIAHNAWRLGFDLEINPFGPLNYAAAVKFERRQGVNRSSQQSTKATPPIPI